MTLCCSNYTGNGNVSFRFVRASGNLDVNSSTITQQASISYNGNYTSGSSRTIKKNIIYLT